jgi:hypothetical protein
MGISPDYRYWWHSAHRLYYARIGEKKYRLLTNDWERYRCVFSPDSRYLAGVAMGASDRNVSVFEMPSGRRRDLQFGSRALHRLVSRQSPPLVRRWEALVSAKCGGVACAEAESCRSKRVAAGLGFAQPALALCRAKSHRPLAGALRRNLSVLRLLSEWLDTAGGVSVLVDTPLRASRPDCVAPANGMGGAAQSEARSAVAEPRRGNPGETV